MVDLGGLVHLSVAETRHLSATADTRLSTRPRYVLVQESVEKLQPLEGNRRAAWRRNEATGYRKCDGFTAEN